MDELIRDLEQIAAADEPTALYPPPLQVWGRYERLGVGTAYHWNGLRRGGDATHPYLFFQYTLAGWGHFTTGGVVHHVLPGMAFTAIVPSEHIYELPPGSPGWSYFWIRITHPYVVQRIARRQAEVGPIIAVEPTSALVRGAVALLQASARPPYAEELAQERAIFDFLWEHERAVRRADRDRTTGERWLDDLRAYVRAALPRAVSVPELAALHGMSRSHFSHAFKHATGYGPAQFVLQVRLEVATHTLLHSTEPVAAIALATGFSNANHFGKVFRERFRLSPGAFRRQMG